MRQGSFTQLAIGILIIAGVVILLIYLGRTAYSSYQIAEDSDCKASIVSQSMLLKLSKNEANGSIYCPTKYYKIPGKNENEIKRAVAESLKTCWGTWGKGELVLFRDRGIYCQVCSVMTFDNKNIKIDGLMDYLATQNIQSESMTYAKYLKYFASDEATDAVKQKISSISSQPELDTSKRYASLFIYAKGKTMMQRFFDWFSPSGGTLSGGAVAGTGTTVLAGGGMLAMGVGFTVAAPVAIIGGIAVGVVALESADDDSYAATNLLVEYDGEKLKELGCTETAAQQDRQKDKIG
jgi:hypothetical protein